MIKNIINWFKMRRFFIIADASDNSITISKSLYKAMDIENEEDIRIFVFRIEDTFGFSINWEEIQEQDVQYCVLQYNSKYKSIGFETLNPTVNRMFYDFNLPVQLTKCKLSVTIESTNKKRIYFKIHKPNA